MSLLSVVVPVYGNEASLPKLLDRLAAVPLPDGVERHAVFVIDGSLDDSEHVLARLLPEWAVPSTLVVLSRNFGSFAAIRAGLERAEGDYVAVLAADLQEPPELLTGFVEVLEADEADVVMGERRGRADPLTTRAPAATFWALYRRFVQPTMPAGGVDVFACTNQVRTQLLALREAHSSLVGLLLWLGFRRATVPYERVDRQHGTSGWTFHKKLRYMSDSIFSFTDLPIRVLLITGVVGCLGASLGAVVVLVAWAMGTVSVPGYTPLMLALLFIGAMVILGLGIVGSYVWRTYENTKVRPLTVEQSCREYTGAPR